MRSVRRTVPPLPILLGRENSYQARGPAFGPGPRARADYGQGGSYDGAQVGDGGPYTDPTAVGDVSGVYGGIYSDLPA